jgi:probable phosphoglycerate mutase
MEDVSRLTAQGETQALELGRALAEQGQHFDRIFISPLARARHTFDQMEKQWRALGFKAYPRCAPTFVPEIQEICLYDWQGHLRKDLEARYPDEFENWMNQPAAFRVGEHFPVRELWARAKRGWELILSQSKPGERVLVVAHSGINQALCFAALGHEEPMYRRLNFPNCGALHLRLALPASPAQTTELVQAGGYTLPVPLMDGEEGVKNSKAPVARHYRRVHPSDWEPEVHLPRTVSAAKAAANTKETVVGSAKR